MERVGASQTIVSTRHALVEAGPVLRLPAVPVGAPVLGVHLRPDDGLCKFHTPRLSKSLPLCVSVGRPKDARKFFPGGGYGDGEVFIGRGQIKESLFSAFALARLFLKNISLHIMWAQERVRARPKKISSLLSFFLSFKKSSLELFDPRIFKIKLAP